ncbi:MAG: hypothetical protein K2Y39_11460 [Candidatus Obscuribacterales bacterium]|nr:hypothetical protein [Candidatus Obscuribacterales bacterium]
MLSARSRLHRSARSRSAYSRGDRGSSGAIIIAMSLVLIAVIFGCFQIMRLIGASAETRRGVESGALGVGKDVFCAKSLKLSKSELKEDQKLFLDVADSNRDLSLANINRAWGQALLVGLNVEDMYKKGELLFQARVNAGHTFDMAKDLSDRLAKKLTNQANLYPLFNQISQQNHATILGANAVINAVPGAQWRTALTDRGEASNISVTPEQLPGASPFKFVKGKDGKSYIPGYEPISVLGYSYNFVPFKSGERNRLIDSYTFDSNTLSAKPFPQNPNPVPNAFSVEGTSANANQTGTRSVAFVQCNPQRAFPLEIPQGFIKVHLKNTAWKQFNLSFSEDGYNSFPEVGFEKPVGAGLGTLEPLVGLGMEYLPPSLYKAIYSLPAPFGDYGKIDSSLLQRCREIKQDCTQKELEQALWLCPTLPGVDDYIIFRVKDTLIALPYPGALNQLVDFVFNLNTGADGKATQYGTEFAAFLPNFTFPILNPDPGAIPVPIFFGTFETGKEDWTPGSGYNGCLGELSIERNTVVCDFGICIPPVP